MYGHCLVVSCRTYSDEKYTRAVRCPAVIPFYYEFIALLFLAIDLFVFEELILRSFTRNLGNTRASKKGPYRVEFFVIGFLSVAHFYNAVLIGCADASITVVP